MKRLGLALALIALPLLVFPLMLGVFVAAFVGEWKPPSGGARERVNERGHPWGCDCGECSWDAAEARYGR